MEYALVPQKPAPPAAPDDESELIQLSGEVRDASVMLRVFGDDLVPAEISRLLGREPRLARAKGDVIPDSRYHRIARTGMWVLDGELPRDTPLELQIEALLDSVTDDDGVWLDLRQRFRLELASVVRMDGDNRGFVLSCRVTQMLAQRGLELGVDIYAP